MDHLRDVRDFDRRLKTIDREIRDVVADTGTTLVGIFGIGPVVAGRILAEVGTVTRFPDKDHFASYNGTAPIDTSSGEQQRHRLSRAGNRRINHALHMAAVTQLRHDTVGRDYFERKLAEGKTRKEALRCLKRRLSDVVYRQLTNDLELTHRTASNETT